MSSSVDPYKTPEAEVHGPGSDFQIPPGAYKDGDDFVVTPGYECPPICFFTGNSIQPQEKQVKVPLGNKRTVNNR